MIQNNQISPIKPKSENVLREIEPQKARNNAIESNINQEESITKQMVDTYLELHPDLKLEKNEAGLFMKMCIMLQANPFKREIYPIKYTNSKMQLVTAYQFYEKRADQSGLLEYMHSDIEYIENPATKELEMHGVCEVKRVDRTRPTIVKIPLKEAQGSKKNNFWREMPRHMTKKVAKAMALREAFPSDLADMPYTSDEMDTDYSLVIEERKLKEAEEKAQQEVHNKAKNELLDEVVNFINQNTQLIEASNNHGFASRFETMRGKKSTTIESITREFNILRNGVAQQKEHQNKINSICNEIKSLMTDNAILFENSDKAIKDVIDVVKSSNDLDFATLKLEKCKGFIDTKKAEIEEKDAVEVQEEETTKKVENSDTDEIPPFIEPKIEIREGKLNIEVFEVDSDNEANLLPNLFSQIDNSMVYIDDATNTIVKYDNSKEVLKLSQIYAQIDMDRKVLRDAPRWKESIKRYIKILKSKGEDEIYQETALKLLESMKHYHKLDNDEEHQAKLAEQQARSQRRDNAYWKAVNQPQNLNLQTA